MLTTSCFFLGVVVAWPFVRDVGHWIYDTRVFTSARVIPDGFRIFPSVLSVERDQTRSSNVRIHITPGLIPTFQKIEPPFTIFETSCVWCCMALRSVIGISRRVLPLYPEFTLSEIALGTGDTNSWDGRPST